VTTSEADRAAAEWEPMTQNHDPRHIAWARECYAAGYEAGATDLDRHWDIARLRAEVERLTRERAAIGSDHHDAISAIRLENYTLRAEVAELTREQDAWNAEAVKMLRQRNVLLEWARVRAGFACGHDVMVAAG
jgi:hypothetical protein